MKKNTFYLLVAFLVSISNQIHAQYITAPEPDSVLFELEQQLINSQSNVNALIDSLVLIVKNDRETISNRRAAIDLLLATGYDRAYDFLLENIDLDLGGPVHIEDMDEPFAGFECFNALTLNNIRRNDWKLFNRLVLLYTKEISLDVIQLSSFVVNGILPGLSKEVTLKCLKESANQMSLNSSERTNFEKNIKEVERFVKQR